MFCWGILVTRGEKYHDIICRRWSHHPSYSFTHYTHVSSHCVRNQWSRVFRSRSLPRNCHLPGSFSALSLYIRYPGAVFIRQLLLLDEEERRWLVPCCFCSPCIQLKSLHHKVALLALCSAGFWGNFTVYQLGTGSGRFNLNLKVTIFAIKILFL